LVSVSAIDLFPFKGAACGARFPGSVKTLFEDVPDLFHLDTKQLLDPKGFFVTHPSTIGNPGRGADVKTHPNGKPTQRVVALRKEFAQVLPANLNIGGPVHWVIL
jgi:hypothetical protein